MYVWRPALLPPKRERIPDTTDWPRGEAWGARTQPHLENGHSTICCYLLRRISICLVLRYILLILISYSWREVRKQLQNT